MIKFTSAFEISVEDVMQVCSEHGREVTYEEAEKLYDGLDRVKITEAALHGDEMEQQTDYAYDEIGCQLREKNFLP